MVGAAVAEPTRGTRGCRWGSCYATAGDEAGVGDDEAGVDGAADSLLDGLAALSLPALLESLPELPESADLASTVGFVRLAAPDLASERESLR